MLKNVSFLELLYSVLSILLPYIFGSNIFSIYLREEAAEAACRAIEELSALVGTNKHLSDLGITESDISALADQAIADVCTPGNPRPVTREDIVRLYHEIL